MRLSELHRAIIHRRRGNSEPEPALTTVSTYLRNAVAKGLLQEVRISKDGKTVSKANKSDRGALAPTRSPNTAYRAAMTPREVFHSTITAIAAAYPSDKRLGLLADVASALEVPKQVQRQIDSWVQRRNGQGRAAN